MKLKSLKLLILATLCASTSITATAAEFSISSYLSKATSGVIYPSEEQIEMLEGVVGNENYIPFEPSQNREYWGAIAQSQEGKDILDEVAGFVDAEPEVPITDEIYRRANKEGNRGIYKPRYYRTMDKLEKFLLAEYIQNDGAYIPQIEKFSGAILAMKSWVHPNHDDKDNGILEGRRVSIDLGARKFGFVLALVINDPTIRQRLSPELIAQIEEQLQYRIIDTYLNSCSGKTPKDNTWITAKSNWNSVCTSGTLLTILTTAKSRAERVAAIGSSINSMKHYLSGFGEDGYCSEGLGYWNYGFGHYLYLAEILYDYTEGKIDLFDFDNPQKMKAIANFPAAYEIHKKWYAPFSDGVTQVADGNDNFAYLFSAKHYGARKPTYFKPDESVFTVIGWRDAAQNTQPTFDNSLPPYTYFDDCGIVISRGGQSTPLSIAVKGGHNGENHNHNDVGSYFILLDEDIVAGDIGAPSYTAGAFSPNNPARSSWGHPVPRINNKLQSSGADFRGTVTSTKFEEGRDFAQLDLIEAYEIPELKELYRTVENQKEGRGKIIVTDKFVASQAVTFGTSVMVNVDYTINGNTIVLSTGNHKVLVEVTAKGGEVIIKDEEVAVKALRSGRRSYRIGIDFVDPLEGGTIEVTYTPLPPQE